MKTFFRISFFKLKKTIFLTFFITAALSATAQKKLPDFKKVIISDGATVRIFHAEKNSAVFDGNNASVKLKKGVLKVSSFQRIQMDTEGRTVKKETGKPQEISLYLNSKIENLTATDSSTVYFDGKFQAERIILNIEKNSVLKGTINAQAFGLNVKSKAESCLKGKFRTVKITADSAKTEFEDFQAANTSLTVSGGSIVSAEGKTEKLNLKISGLSRFEALRLTTKNSEAAVSGNSDVFFNVSGTLKINISERSHVVLTGRPVILEEKTEKGCKFSKR
jgi:hypothetical protein